MRIPNQTSGETIRLGRLRLGLTQQQLVDKLNDALPSHEFIERSMISRWEKDLHFPRNSRKEALERILSAKLGNPPPRRESFASYTTNQTEIQKSLLLGLQNCSEVWMTTAIKATGAWQDPQVKRVLDRLRRNEGCTFKEIFYVRSYQDLKIVRQIAESGYSNYRIRVRVAPGHPLPVLLAPNSRYGIFLSGFGDDIPNVGLELNGQIAGFIEHYFRYLWDNATPILEEGVINSVNIKRVNNALKDLGGAAPSSFNKS